jgi:hypothetical protein
MRLVVSFIILLFLTAPAFSQKGNPVRNNHEEIQAIKVAYISKKVNLSSDEAKDFWPVYNAYQKEIGGLMHQRWQNFKNQKGNASAKLDDEFDYEGRILELKKKYKTEFTKILPPEKVFALYRAEREWKEHLIQELKERKKN